MEKLIRKIPSLNIVLKKAHHFLITHKHTRIFTLVVLLVAIIIIPLTVIVSQKQQKEQLRQQNQQNSTSQNQMLKDQNQQNSTNLLNSLNAASETTIMCKNTNLPLYIGSLTQADAVKLLDELGGGRNNRLSC